MNKAFLTLLSNDREVAECIQYAKRVSKSKNVDPRHCSAAVQAALLWKSGLTKEMFFTIDDLIVALTALRAEPVYDVETLDAGDVCVFAHKTGARRSLVLCSRVGLDGKAVVIDHQGRSFYRRPFEAKGYQFKWAYRLPQLRQAIPSNDSRFYFFKSLACMFDHVSDLGLSKEEKKEVLEHLNAIRRLDCISNLKI